MTNTGENINIKINGQRLEQVEEYIYILLIYIGQRMKLNRENQEAEIVRKIKLSWAAFGKLRGILENKNLAQHQNTRVFDMCLLPAMTYGSQMWTMTKRNMDRLIRTQRAMERRMLHITLRDRKHNIWI